MDRAQSDYFNQYSHGWMEGHQNLQGRSSMGSGVRPSHGPMGNLPHSIAGTIDPFSADLSVPSSQLNYTEGYVPSYGTPFKREY